MNILIPYRYLFQRKPKTRTFFLLLSILTHCIVLLILSLLNPKAGRKHFNDHFDRNAMRVVNMAPSTKMVQPTARVKSKLATPYRRHTPFLSKIGSIPQIPPILPRMATGNGPRISPKQKEVAVAETVRRGGQAIHKKVNYLLADKASQSNRQITKLESPIENKPQAKKQLTSHSLPSVIHLQPSIKQKNKPLVKVQTVIEHRHTTKIRVSPWRQAGVVKPVSEQPESLDYRRNRGPVVEIRSVSSPRLVRERRLKYEGRNDQAEQVNMLRVRASYKGDIKEVERRSMSKRSGWWRGVVEQVKQAKPMEPVDSFSRQGLVARSSSRESQGGMIRKNLALSAKHTKQSKLAAGLGSSRRLVRERRLKYEGRNDQAEQVDIPRVRASYKGDIKEVERRSMRKHPGWWREATEQVEQAKPMRPVDSFSRQGLVARSSSRESQGGMIRKNLALSAKHTKQSKLAAGLGSSRRLVRERRLKYEGRNDQAEQVDIPRVRASYKGDIKEVERRSMSKHPGWWREATEQVKQAKPMEPVDSFSRQGLVARSSSRESQGGMIRKNLALSAKHTKQSKLAAGLGSSRRLVRERRLKYEGRNDQAEQVDIPRVRASYHTGHTEIDKKYMDKPHLVTETTDISYTPEPTTPQVVKRVKQKFDGNPKGKASFALSSAKLVVPNNPVQQKDKRLISSIVRGGMRQRSPSPKKDKDNHTHPDHTFDKKRLGTVKVSFDNKGFNKPYSSQLADILKNNLVLHDLATDGANIKIELNLPFGNKTDQQLYKLTGFIDSGVRTAFLTINNITQVIYLSNSAFKTEVALQEGINELSLIAINSRGEMSTKSFKLLFVSPPRGVPRISLDSPKNGMHGVREGDQVTVAGTISDPSITQAVLLVNNIPLKIEVKNGHFKKRVFLPKGRIITFRVMAKNKNGVLGYSPLHTALSAHEVNINNQRPF